MSHTTVSDLDCKSWAFFAAYPRRAQVSGIADQPVAFLWGDCNPLGQLAAQDVVLYLQIPDMSGKFLLIRSGNDQKQGSIDVSHDEFMVRAQLTAVQDDDFIFAPRYAACICRALHRAPRRALAGC